MRPDTAMPLLCEFGWHDPQGIAQWNNGYYFTKCRRCHRDLVRTAFGAWQIPRGHRVVWQAHAPPGTLRAELCPLPPPGSLAQDVEPAPRRVSPDGELPITEVLRHLARGEGPEALDATRAQDVEGTGVADEVERPDVEDLAGQASAEVETLPEQTAEVSAEPTAAAPPEEEAAVSEPGDPEAAAATTATEASAAELDVSRVGDFMSDRRSAPTEDASDAIPDAEPNADEIPSVRTEVESAPAGLGWFGRLKRERPEKYEGGHNESLGAIIPARRTAETSSSPAIAYVALGAVVVMLAVVAILIARQETPGRAEKPAALGNGSPSLPAYVTASVLNCRSAPARQAPSVRRLRRGDSVQIVARDDRWASLAHEGGQCWALLRYLSRQPPL